MAEIDTVHAFIIYVLFGVLTALISILGLIIWTWVQSIKASINHLRVADEEIRKLVTENCDQVHQLLNKTEQNVAVLSNTVANEKEAADEFKADFKEFQKLVFKKLENITGICRSLKAE